MGLRTHRFAKQTIHNLQCHQVTNRGDILQIWRVAANIQTKQPQTADKGRSSSLAAGWRANNSSTCYKIKWCSFSGCLQHILVKCSPKLWQSFDQPPQNWKRVIRHYDLNRSLEHGTYRGKREMHARFSWRNMKHESQVDKHYTNKHCADTTKTQP